MLRDEPARADAIRPEVGAALADICGRCLEKTPSERFSSCEEILDALDAPELGIPAAFPPERASVRRVSSPSLPPPTRAGSNDAPAAPRRFLTYALVAAVAAIGGVAIYMRPKPIAGPTAAASASAAATAITDVPPPKSSSPAALAAYAHALQASRDADWGLAREQYKEALALDPKLAPAHLRIAMIMNFEKDGPSESRAEFAKALNGRADLSPRDQAIANALEPVIARDPGENDLTTQRLRELTVKYPNDAEIHHTYAVFGMYGSADGIAAERRAIQIDPQYADAWQILGGELAVAGHREEALAALAKCVEIAPLSADCRGERARLYSLDGQCGKAEDDLRRALSSSSRSVLMWHEDRAAALFAIGRSDETVIEALRPKWQLYSDARRQSVELYDRALLAVSRGRFAEAERLLIQGETAIENDPNSDPHVRYASLRIGVLNETGRPKEAAKVAKVFLDKKDLWLSRQFASDRTVPMLRVMEHAGLIPMSQVIKERDAWLEHAKSLGTGEPPSFLWSAAYVANMERRDEAQAAFDAQPTQELGHPRQMIDMEVGTMYALLGRSAEAIPHLSRAVRQCDWFRWPIWNTIAVERLGDAYAETNQKKEACEAYALVTTRWASATKSVTRDLAKEHAARLGCGALASQPLIAMPEPAAPAAPPPFPRRRRARVDGSPERAHSAGTARWVRRAARAAGGDRRGSDLEVAGGVPEGGREATRRRGEAARCRAEAPREAAGRLTRAGVRFPVSGFRSRREEARPNGEGRLPWEDALSSGPGTGKRLPGTRKRLRRFHASAFFALVSPAAPPAVEPMRIP